MYVRLNREEIEKINQALEVKKYGDLDSWKLLVKFQACCHNIVQVKEIGEFAKRHNSGDNILLPLMRNVSLVHKVNNQQNDKIVDDVSEEEINKIFGSK